MESLAEETWDLVIAGTSLVQALLALSLSRSDLKILHVDQNSYYGGTDAGLSLDEAKLWAEQHEDASRSYSNAYVSQPTATTSPSSLKNSRSYTLSLNPQIVYAQSSFLPSLVSSGVNTQLEFMAVGSWWLYKNQQLQKVPSSREDVFADASLSRRDKIGLMKFLRYVVQEDTEEAEVQQDPPPQDESLHSALTSKFKISSDLHLPIASLALAQQSIHDTEVEAAVRRIRRHMRSIGYFGPGFGAVIAKYAGNAEIAQVCCRACAVGGATYLLGQGVSNITVSEAQEIVEVTLSGGVTVKAKHVVGGVEDLPQELVKQFVSTPANPVHVCHSINIVSSPLRHLFPQTSENGPIPAAAIVLVTDQADAGSSSSQPPIYLRVHSEDTGECPTGQCIIYASTLHPDNAELSITQERLVFAVQKVLAVPTNTESTPEGTTVSPELLWSMSYSSTSAKTTESPEEQFMQDKSGRVISFNPRREDIAFDDSVLTTVKAVWKKILGEAADDLEFLRLEDRSESQNVDD